MQYNAVADVTVKGDHTDQLLDDLADYSPALAVHGARTSIIITLPADSLRQAITTALGVIEGNTGQRVLALHVLPTADFDRRHGLDPVPELVSLQEAGEILGKTRQAVAQQIDSFETATRVGTTWAITRAEVERRATPTN